MCQTQDWAILVRALVGDIAGAVFFGKTVNSHSASFLFGGVTPIYELVPNPGEEESSNTLVALCHVNRSETGLILL